MRIIIVGAGAVGTIVAERLSAGRHDVILVEQADEVVSKAQQAIDAMVVQGNGASARVLQELEVERADMLIAVTDNDEINILACLQAHRLGVKTKIARVRNAEYSLDGKPAFDGIDTMINPDRVAVEEIHELLLKKAATDIHEFADGRVQVIGARVEAGSLVEGKSLSEIEREVGSRWALVAAITRQQETIIPCGEDVLEENDHVFLVGRTGKIASALQYVALEGAPVEHVMILGANRIGVNLARDLSAEGVNIKLVDADERRAERASRRLERSLVLHGDATDLELLKSEGIEDMDAFVAVSADEEMNLTASLLARHHGATKVICLIKRPNYVPLASIIGIDAAVSPRLSTARAIMRYFRQGNVLSLTSLRENESEIMELVAAENSTIVKKPLAQIEFPRNALVGAIIKPYQVVIPRGGDVVEPGDKVLVFALESAVKAVRKLFG